MTRRVLMAHIEKTSVRCCKELINRPLITNLFMEFEKSANLEELASALVGFQAEMENVKRDSQNPFYKSRYSSFANIIALPSRTFRNMDFLSHSSHLVITNWSLSSCIEAANSCKPRR